MFFSSTSTATGRLGRSATRAAKSSTHVTRARPGFMKKFGSGPASSGESQRSEAYSADIASPELDAEVSAYTSSASTAVLEPPRSMSPSGGFHKKFHGRSSPSSMAHVVQGIDIGSDPAPLDGHYDSEVSAYTSNEQEAPRAVSPSRNSFMKRYHGRTSSPEPARSSPVSYVPEPVSEDGGFFSNSSTHAEPETDSHSHSYDSFSYSAPEPARSESPSRGSFMKKFHGRSGSPATAYNAPEPEQDSTPSFSFTPAHSHEHDHSHSHSHAHSHSHDHGHEHGHSHSHSHDHGHTHSHVRSPSPAERARSPSPSPDDEYQLPKLRIGVERVRDQFDHTNKVNGHSHSHTHSHSHSHSHKHEEKLEQWKQGVRNPIMNQGHGRGRVLFVDASTSGCAGDMLVAALLDLGVPRGVIEQGLSKLGLKGYTVEIYKASKSGISAPRFVVNETQKQPFRDYAAIKRLIEDSELEQRAKSIALEAFRRLAVAEANVHGLTLDTVHFHEVGAVDSIVDIVAAAIGFAYIDAEQVIVSPLPVGRGLIHGAAHGPLPNPPPATLTVLCESNIPTFFAGCKAELVTPTGACIVSAVASSTSWWPSINPERNSYGSGTKDFDDRPNLVRLVMGKPLETNSYLEY